MRKKILIINNNLHIGGVQKALVSLLWNIRDCCDVTLLLFYDGGELMKQLPQEISVITPISHFRYLGMSRQDAVSWKDKVCRAVYAGITRIFGRKYAASLMGMGQEGLGDYDVAISYLHNAGEKTFYGGCNDFLLNHVSAKKKITFLHCDYSLCGADTPDNNRQYGRFDTIAACSQGCADAFLKVNPHLAEKVMVVPNCHRFDQIRSLASAEAVSMNPEKINLVTVSRFGREKGVERALDVIAALGSQKERIHYYIIGDGIQKPMIQSAIKQKNLCSCVTLCGHLENPYPYIRAADILVIPSRSEAAPLVIGEAACLGTPILSMKTSSAVEMIEETGYGWVCENSENAMKEKLEELIAEPEALRTVRERLQSQVFQNETALQQFSICIESGLYSMKSHEFLGEENAHK